MHWLEIDFSQLHRWMAQISVQLMAEYDVTASIPRVVNTWSAMGRQICKDSPTGTVSVDGWPQPFMWKQKEGCLSWRFLSSEGSSRVKACMLQCCGTREEPTGALYFVSKTRLVVNYSFDFNILFFFNNWAHSNKMDFYSSWVQNWMKESGMECLTNKGRFCM